ncbi:MAG TPA: hypothetical protein VFS15_27835 [Kofleriaceae bacterium]|nr:hypothetical protein [Kofleriaceae bacterium]
MTIAELDEVDYDLEVDGEQVRRQLARQIFEDRGWATVAVAFQERDAAGEWKPPKVALLRFRRLHEVWKKQAVITLALDEARALAGAITSWQL